MSPGAFMVGACRPYNVDGRVSATKPMTTKAVVALAFSTITNGHPLTICLSSFAARIGCMNP